uniref:Uncharacterized protein n=1 Tax=Arundo donax TaxID=35708 RepID=A0A0A9E8Y2_ARUDO
MGQWNSGVSLTDLSWTL